MQSLISPITVKRLSLYLRYLEDLKDQGRSTVSSSQLGQALRLTAAQVRKDLAYFGQFGKPGVGYQVAALANRLRRIFGTDKVTNVAVIGVGSLGVALLRYKGWLKKGFRLVAAFETEPSKTGRKIGGIVVQPISKLAPAVKRDRIRLAILAVPADVAQQVVDRLCRAGIRGILNFAPVTLTGTEDVAVVPVDLAVQLEQLSYLANSPKRKERPRPKSAARRQS